MGGCSDIAADSSVGWSARTHVATKVYRTKDPIWPPPCGPALARRRCGSTRATDCRPNIFPATTPWARCVICAPPGDRHTTTVGSSARRSSRKGSSRCRGPANRHHQPRQRRACSKGGSGQAPPPQSRDLQRPRCGLVADTLELVGMMNKPADDRCSDPRIRAQRSSPGCADGQPVRQDAQVQRDPEFPALSGRPHRAP